MTLLILTVALAPNVAGPIALANESERLCQYKRAIAAWVRFGSAHKIGIFAVETTGRSQILREHIPEAVSILPFEATPQQRARGKGAVESAALDYTLRHLFSEGMSRSESVYKCTGRLTVKNAHQVIWPLPEGTLVARAPLMPTFLDTRFFGASLSVWKDLLSDAWPEVDDTAGIYLERVLGRRVLVGLAHDKVHFSRFPQRPRYTGTSGSTGASYGSPSRRVAQLAARPAEWLVRRIPADKQF